MPEANATATATATATESCDEQAVRLCRELHQRTEAKKEAAAEKVLQRIRDRCVRYAIHLTGGIIRLKAGQLFSCSEHTLPVLTESSRTSLRSSDAGWKKEREVILKQGQLARLEAQWEEYRSTRDFPGSQDPSFKLPIRPKQTVRSFRAVLKKDAKAAKKSERAHERWSQKVLQLDAKCQIAHKIHALTDAGSSRQLLASERLRRINVYAVANEKTLAKHRNDGVFHRFIRGIRALLGLPKTVISLFRGNPSAHFGVGTHGQVCGEEVKRLSGCSAALPTVKGC